DRVDAVGGQLIAVGVNVAHALGAQFILYRHKEVEERVPGIRKIRDLEARLLDQWPPYMEWPAGDPQRHQRMAALFRYAVVVERGLDGDRGEIFFLGFDHVADIGELVVPGAHRGDFEVGIFQDVGDDPALDRRDRLLTQRREWDDAEIDLVAA